MGEAKVLAFPLESGSVVGYGTGENGSRIAVPELAGRELGIECSRTGAEFTVDLALIWVGDGKPQCIAQAPGW